MYPTPEQIRALQLLLTRQQAQLARLDQTGQEQLLDDAFTQVGYEPDWPEWHRWAAAFLPAHRQRQYEDAG